MDCVYSRADPGTVRPDASTFREYYKLRSCIAHATLHDTDIDGVQKITEKCWSAQKFARKMILDVIDQAERLCEIVKEADGLDTTSL